MHYGRNLIFEHLKAAHRNSLPQYGESMFASWGLWRCHVRNWATDTDLTCQGPICLTLPDEERQRMHRRRLDPTYWVEDITEAQTPPHSQPDDHPHTPRRLGRERTSKQGGRPEWHTCGARPCCNVHSPGAPMSRWHNPLTPSLNTSRGFTWRLVRTSQRTSSYSCSIPHTPHAANCSPVPGHV